MSSDVLIIIGFIIINIAIGVICKKNLNTLKTFSVGERNFSAWAIFATLSATFIGGGFTFGNASKVYHYGIIYAFTLFGFSLKEILVATIIAPRMDAHKDCISIGDLIKKTYGKWPQVITGLLSILVCTGILGAQVGALGAICQAFFNINPLWGILTGFALVIFYSSLGGMRAVVYTDIFQFAILAIGIPLVFFIGIHYVGGWHQLAAKLPAHYLNQSFSHINWQMLIPLFLTFIVGETLVPPYVQRLLMAKHSNVTRLGTLASGLFSMPFFIITGGIGLIAFALNPHLAPNLALPYVVKTVCPPIIRGVVIASLIAIVLSTASGFLNAAAITAVNDIVKPLKPNTQHNLLIYARIGTIITGVGAIAFALTISNILDILLISYNFWAPIMLAPLIAAIFQLKVGYQHFFIGAIVGALTMLVTKYLVPSLLGPIPPIIAAVLLNGLSFTLAYYWIKPKTL